MVTFIFKNTAYYLAYPYDLPNNKSENNNNFGRKSRVACLHALVV